MAGAIATGMARETFAQDDIPSLTPHIDIIDEANQSTTIIDNIQENILLYARTQVAQQRTTEESARKTNEFMLKNSMTALQRALNEFRGGILEEITSLPESPVTGALDAKTARALIANAREIRFYEVLFPPALNKYDADTFTGLAMMRDALKNLAPQEYILALESVTAEVDALRELAEDRAQVGMVMEFKQCALHYQQEIPTAKQLSTEIERVSTQEGYVSQFVSEDCYIYTKELPMAALRAAQLDFLNESPTISDDRTTWCYRSAPGFNGPTCAIRNL